MMEKKPQKKVVVSSTARDLPEHRKEVMDACLRQGMFPVMMEYLPASDAEAISASIKMVDEADIYVGVFAHRYGYVPEGYEISVTEMEYNRAVERKMPRLIFVMGKDHALKIEDVEVETAAQLKKFKDRVGTKNIVNFFNSPADLRAHVINSLSQLREPDLTAFHYVSDIPSPPEAFIAHPYTLLQTHRLIGRQAELNLLTDWVAKPSSEAYAARIFNIVALGGVGKSALTWHWFDKIAPQEMKPLAGRMWWSFYESDASFENFVTRALAYVTRRPLAEVQQIPSPDREAQLLAHLDREPFLIVLDGLERLLIAYARMDAARLIDDDYDRQTANEGIHLDGIPGSATKSPTVDLHRLRKTADPRAGAFFRKLAMTRAARILVSTRLYQADLENKVNGNPLAGCFKCDLRGLAEVDALELWRTFGAKGSRDQLLPVFRKVENHPLLIQSLAAEVARFRRAPGDFTAWREANPDFNPFRDIPLVQMKSHILEFALHSLDKLSWKVLHTIAAFRMPANYDTLAKLLMGDEDSKVCINEQTLDAGLAELEDRGLVGWDKRANRYDLHPIVRGVVWDGISAENKQRVYSGLQAHFESFPRITNWSSISTIEDLTPAIELYNALAAKGLYEEALQLYKERLFGPLQFKLSQTGKQVEFLKMVFTDSSPAQPKVKDSELATQALRYLAESFHRCGQPKVSIDLYKRCINYSNNSASGDLQLDDPALRGRFSISHLQMLSDAFYLTGALYQSCLVSSYALKYAHMNGDRWHEGIVLSRLGLNCAARGYAQVSDLALNRSVQIFRDLRATEREGGLYSLMAQLNLWAGSPMQAQYLANQAWDLAHDRAFERDFIRAARLQGEAALAMSNFSTADERLHMALTRARNVNYAEEELPALIALADLRMMEAKPAEARELIDGVWDISERGPYPLSRADALNVLAQIERSADNCNAAIEAATQAYCLAWCDGPPYAYHWGLLAAQKQLEELGAPLPNLPAFDPAKFEPMPEVEIDPEDEFRDRSLES